MHHFFSRLCIGLLFILSSQSCQSQAPASVQDQATSRVNAYLQTHAPALPDTAFTGLMNRLSEAGGYFDTDNLISNETSYLHVMGTMRELGVSGGAYLGVGPDQNFSYIAQVRPEIAFISDIRRDNVLQHLWFKALFLLSENRMAYLCNLFGRASPSDVEGWADRAIEDVVAYLDQTPVSEQVVEVNQRAIHALLAHFPFPLSDQDKATIDHIYERFIAGGLDLKFTSHGRSARWTYPNYRDLMLEQDLTGRKANYLVREEDYQVVRTLQINNLIVPIVGDLAGPHALKAVGQYLTEHEQTVSAFYTSNVEFYLMRQRSFPDYAENVRHLPIGENSVLIRSFFRGFNHPQAVPGYYSTQLLQTMQSFVEEYERGGLQSYSDVVYKHSLELVPEQ